MYCIFFIKNKNSNITHTPVSLAYTHTHTHTALLMDLFQSYRMLIPICDKHPYIEFTKFYLLPLESEFADADQVLCNLGKSLLALMSDESWPVDEVLVYLFQSLLIVLAQSYLQ